MIISGRRRIGAKCDLVRLLKRDRAIHTMVLRLVAYPLPPDLACETGNQ